jgi:protein-tyrosine phosphatase
MKGAKALGLCGSQGYYIAKQVTQRTKHVYDIHCHLLPEIDDGSPDLAYSLEMARFAEAHGTTHMVVTPHIHPGRYDNDKAIIAETFLRFKRAVVDDGLKLKLGMAAELRLSAEVLTLFAEKKIPFLGESDGISTLLLELPHDQVPPGSENLVDWLAARKCRVMIAHPERNKEIMRNPERLHTFLDRGCLTQVTAGSLVGRFGKAVQDIAEQLLTEGKVDVLASDSHNLKYRTPDLNEGYQRAIELVGETAAIQLVVDNPRSIVASQFA